MEVFKDAVIYGTGSWGSALAIALHRAGFEKISMLSRNEKSSTEINENKNNERYLPGISFPKNIDALVEGQNIEEYGLAVIAVPSIAAEEALKDIKKRGLSRSALVLVASKGLCPKTGDLFSKIFPGIVKNEIAFISGPNFAREVALGLPTKADLACENYPLAVKAARAVSSEHFTVKPMGDVITPQISGALKNIAAIKAGIYEALGYGENARAALVTDALKEIGILSQALGGKPESLLENSALGDLVLTSFSKTSRNNRFGYEWASSKDKESFLKNLPYLTEGLFSLRSLVKLADRHKVKLPLVESVAQEFGIGN